MSKKLKKPTIHVATDHAGFECKEAVKEWLESEGYMVVDHGASKFAPLDDFNDYIAKAAKAVSLKKMNRGIIFGGSGQGEAMMANRFKGVRAVVYYGGNEEIVRLSRHHNDANVLSIGARFVDINQAKKVIWDWLHAELLKDKKYARRNRKLDKFS